MAELLHQDLHKGWWGWRAKNVMEDAFSLYRQVLAPTAHAACPEQQWFGCIQPNPHLLLNLIWQYDPCYHSQRFFFFNYYYYQPNPISLSLGLDRQYYPWYQSIKHKVFFYYHQPKPYSLWIWIGSAIYAFSESQVLYYQLDTTCLESGRGA